MSQFENENIEFKGIIDENLQKQTSEEDKIRELQRRIFIESLRIGFSGPQIDTDDEPTDPKFFSSEQTSPENLYLLNAARYPRLYENRMQERMAFSQIYPLYDEIQTKEGRERVRRKFPQSVEIELCLNLYNSLIGLIVEPVPLVGPKDPKYVDYEISYKKYRRLLGQYFDAFLNDENPRIEKGIVKCNMLLVFSIAKELSIRGLIRLDSGLESGTIGLMHAIANFDPTLGIMFSTYATHSIEGFIKRAIPEERGEKTYFLYNANRLARLIKENGGIMPPIEEIMERLNIKTKQRVEDLIYYYENHYGGKSVFSYDVPLRLDNEFEEGKTLGDTFESKQTPTNTDRVNEMIEQFRQNLTALQYEILYLRYGNGLEIVEVIKQLSLLGYPPLTSKELLYHERDALQRMSRFNIGEGPYQDAGGEAIKRQAFREKIILAGNVLTEREKNVLGFRLERGLTLENTAKALAQLEGTTELLTRERIRQLLVKSEKRLDFIARLKNNFSNVEKARVEGRISDEEYSVLDLLTNQDATLEQIVQFLMALRHKPEEEAKIDTVLIFIGKLISKIELQTELPMDIIERYLYLLAPREREVTEYFYGLGGRERVGNLNDIAERLHINKSVIYATYTRALEKIKKTLEKHT